MYLWIGRLRWERLRTEWLTPVNGQVVKRTGEVRSKSVDPEDVIERIFSPSGKRVFNVLVIIAGLFCFVCIFNCLYVDFLYLCLIG
jgi:hypothetical protein